MHHRFEEWKHQHGFARGFGHGGDDKEQQHWRGARHWGGRGEGFGGQRGPERPFDHGELRLVVLALIAERPRHGYEIIKAIEERCGGGYSPSPGVVYPTLTLLEELGNVTVEAGGGKKLHTITAEGTAYLEANKAAVDAAMGRMEQLGAQHGGGRSPQLMRAMQNFRMALHLRQRRGPLTEEQLNEIAAAIDAAAIAIERS